MKNRHNAYRNGRIHVCRRMCPTCIFRPKMALALRPGRRDQMATEATKNESAIICHSTLSGNNAACRGFFDRHKTQPLQIAERLNLLQMVDLEKTS